MYVLHGLPSTRQRQSRMPHADPSIPIREAAFPQSPTCMATSYKQKSTRMAWLVVELRDQQNLHMHFSCMAPFFVFDVWHSTHRIQQSVRAVIHALQDILVAVKATMTAHITKVRLSVIARLLPCRRKQRGRVKDVDGRTAPSRITYLIVSIVKNTRFEWRAHRCCVPRDDGPRRRSPWHTR